MEWGRTPFCMDATWRPSLPADRRSHSWLAKKEKRKKKRSHKPFKTFEATLHNVSKFPFHSTKNPKGGKKISLSVRLFFCTPLDVSSSLKPPANRAKINKARSSTVRWKGNFLDFCKNGWGREHQRVSARRFLAIDDLSAGVEGAWNLAFFSGSIPWPPFNSQ